MISPSLQCENNSGKTMASACVQIDEIDHVTRVRLQVSAIDSDTAFQVAREFNDLLDDNKPKFVVCDMSAVRYISSVGIGLLAELNKKVCSAGGVLRLFNLQPFVRDAIIRIKFTRLDLQKDETAALQGL